LPLFYLKIGFPNVGKSSILNALTRARSKIGDYSFTTLYPHVGIVEYEDDTQISIADLPGVINDPTRGLGTNFLRHLERTKILLIVIDLSLNDSYEKYIQVKDILEKYDENIFSNKRCIVIANKIDSENSMDNLKKIKPKIDLPIIPMSTVEKINLTKFLILLKSTYDSL
jgi:GTPase